MVAHMVYIVISGIALALIIVMGLDAVPKSATWPPFYLIYIYPSADSPMWSVTTLRFLLPVVIYIYIYLWLSCLLCLSCIFVCYFS